MKIKVNIPGFGERYCSDNVEYKIYYNSNCYIFYKKGTDIVHNEYGPAIESKDGGYKYFINNKLHRLSDYAYNFLSNKKYYVLDKFLGRIRENFIKNLANVLIPKNEDYL